MYHNYNSLRESIHKEIENQKSVLNKFPEQISRPITQSVSKYLAQFTSYQLPLKSEAKSTDGDSQQQQSNLQTASSGNNSGNNLDQSNGSMIIQLETIEQVNWTLENLMYGLTLSHDHQDIIKDCWHVYHDWMTVLLDEPRAFVPQPIRDEPGLYAKRMLWHLYHLFVPRLSASSSSSQVVAPTKHIMMCHAVLVLIESIAKDSKLLTRELWEEFLKFFLAINEAVLAPPFNKTDDFGEALSSRIVATLFEIWLIACHKMFPSPSLWRTFQELCANWRHHISLVTEWNRVCYALTNRLLELTSAMTTTSSTNSTSGQSTNSSGSSEPPPSIPIMSNNRAVSFNLTSNTSSSSDTNVAYDINGIIGQMSLETVMQSWFRFLHIVGRPVDFSDSLAISKQLEVATRLQQTRLATIGSSSTAGSIDQIAVVAATVAAQSNASAAAQNQLITSFPCVKKLPIIFLEVMKGVSRIVDSFILIQPSSLQFNTPYYTSTASKTSTSALTSGPGIDQRIRSKSVYASSNTSTASVPPASNQDTASQVFRINIYKANRPNVNSLLHLVGQWLFDAAARSITSSPNATPTPDAAHHREFVLGQAEAFGALCRIFCSVKTNETILPEYLSRFYALLLHGLRVPSNLGDMINTQMEYDSGEILASILVNGVNLFKVDLKGVNVLLIPMLNVLNAIFKLKYPQKEDPRSENKSKELLRTTFNIGSGSVSLVDLKKYCIHIFASLLSIPNHFSSLTLIDPMSPQSSVQYHTLRSKILEIFLAAMTNEQDTSNLQMLFGCGKLIVGEWTLDELVPSNNSSTNKKEKAIYCYNQIVTLICAPLRINHATLQNHLFALSIFDSLASIVANQHLLPNDESNAIDSVSKTAVSWVWHYVRMQIKRKSKEHTKEMHSVIVAAYNCLIMLLIAKPSLLRDKQYLQTVLNCIEIGISGSSSSSLDSTSNTSGSNLKESSLTGASSAMSIASSSNSSSANSTGTSGNSSGMGSDMTSSNSGSGANNSASGSSGIGHSSSTMLKADKELKPASLRVKEAAECVLCFLMEHTSIPPSLTPSTPYSHLIGGKNIFFEEAIRQPLDEKSLTELTNRTTDNKFKYYALDGSLILGILERPLVKDSLVSSVCPTVTVLLRGPFGQQAWSMHLRPSPFSKLEQRQEVKFNLQSNEATSNNHKYYSNRDTLKALDSNAMMMIDNDSMSHEHAGGDESECDQSLKNEREDDFDETQSEKSTTSPFKNRGVKNQPSNRRPKCESSVPSLNKIARKYCKQLPKFQKIKDEQIEFENGAVEKAIRESGPSFAKLKASLKTDMALNLRNCQEFQSSRILLSSLGYCSISETSRKDQETLPDLLSLESSDQSGSLADHIAYLDKLPTRTFSACYIFYVKSGQTDLKSIMSNTSPDVQLDKSFYLFIQSLGSIINSSSSFNPTEQTDSKKRLNSINGTENILLWSDVVSEIGFVLPNSENKLADAQIDEKLKFKYQSLPSDLKVMIVWVERIQDADSVPVEELVQETFSLDSTTNVYKPKEIIVIFIHPLENKLNRIITWSNTNKKYCYTIPLIDGMVVSSRMLSSMIRQTVLNIFRRKRLEIDDYQPPHVKRKNKISEIIKKFMTKKNEPELFTSLLMGLKTESV